MNLVLTPVENSKGRVVGTATRLKMDIIRQAYKEVGEQQYHEDCDGKQILLKDCSPSLVVYLACGQPLNSFCRQNSLCLEHTGANRNCEKWFARTFFLSHWEVIAFDEGFSEGRAWVDGKSHAKFDIDETPMMFEKDKTTIKEERAYLFGLYVGHFLFTPPRKR